MKIIKSIKAWKLDRAKVSMQKHEIAYIRKLARKYLTRTENKDIYHLIRTSSLRKMCKYILKTKPKIRK